jgi:hypothetical protein
MRSSILYTAVLTASIASAVPAGKREFSPDNVYFPLANGFPNPSQDKLLQIQIDAHGTIPNGGPPPKLSPEGITNLQLIALNEIFEVAYFTELVFNLTEKVPGYDLGYGHQYVLDALHSIVAQEQIHLLNANGALKKFNFQAAIRLAGTFTDLVMGTLQDVNMIFAQNGDAGLVRAVSSVIGNEGEQEGFFRLVQKKRPSAQPFLTTSTRDFAFSALQGFVIPGSCPNLSTIKLKTFKALAVETPDIKAATQNIKFSVAKKDADVYQAKELKVVYINAQNVPIVKHLENVQILNEKVTFEAAFPYDEFLLNGLTVVAVTHGKESFASADEVSDAAVFGPGLIEID